MASKIREALSKASIALSWASHHHLTEDDAKECLEVVDAALAAPSEPVGNAATMREALAEIRNIARAWLGTDDNIPPARTMGTMLVVANAALAAPPRNCDVGTAEEQTRRMNRFCDNYGRYSDGEPKCNDCPLRRKVIEDGGKCELWWSQMPYEEGGAE